MPLLETHPGGPGRDGRSNLYPDIGDMFFFLRCFKTRKIIYIYISLSNPTPELSSNSSFGLITDTRSKYLIPHVFFCKKIPLKKLLSRLMNIENLRVPPQCLFPPGKKA